MRLLPRHRAAACRPPVIRTGRLVLRGLDARDFDAFADFFGSERSRFVGGPLDREMAWKVLARVIGHWTLRGYGTLGFAPKGSDGPAIGMAGPWFPEGWPEPEIGWMLWDETREGQGYAHEAVEAVRAWTYRTLGWRTAVSFISPDNARSIALAERLGARPDTDTRFPDADPCIAYRHPAPEMLQ